MRGVYGIVDGVFLYNFTVFVAKVCVRLGVSLFEEFLHGGEQGERVAEEYFLALSRAFEDDMPRVFACPVGFHDPRLCGAVVVLGKEIGKNVCDFFSQFCVVADAGDKRFPIAWVWELEVEIGSGAKVFELLLAGFAGVPVGAVWGGHNFVEAIVPSVFFVDAYDLFECLCGHEPVALDGLLAFDIFCDEA